MPKIVRILKEPRYVFLLIGISILFFDLSYYLMAFTPGFENYMCVIGASLTTSNIIFSAVLGILFGLMVVSMTELVRMKRSKVAASSASGLGMIVGGLTVFCPLCVLPTISFFGVSVFFSLVVEYNLIFKAASMILMIGGLYLMNGQLKEDCLVCNIVGKDPEA
ncbi:hypothetical protein HN709_02295 [Candidatus Peregrinibacteria bacterium]|jgi:hypothetical protein|nr:hypothetical protein [Candidatus Peregrinibacteria bacterium]MBT7736493.1 hypothetical protein [Candidatus Peregrinibacteria bacterium]